MFAAFARLRDAELGDWVEREVSLPELDGRPHHAGQTTDDDRAEVRAAAAASRISWPVVCEPFAQWVLEDAFSLGRPPYEAVDVQVVDDVGPTSS